MAKACLDGCPCLSGVMVKDLSHEDYIKHRRNRKKMNRQSRVEVHKQDLVEKSRKQDLMEKQSVNQLERECHILFF